MGAIATAGAGIGVEDADCVAVGGGVTDSVDVGADVDASVGGENVLLG
jgi:hypothetical protein